MNKLKLNREHIVELADNNAQLDGMDYAAICDAKGIYLGYNTTTKTLCLYDEDDWVLCRVKDLIPGSPSALATSEEELNKQMDFVGNNVPKKDTLDWLIKEAKREKIETMCDFSIMLGLSTRSTN